MLAYIRYLSSFATVAVPDLEYWKGLYRRESYRYFRPDDLGQQHYVYYRRSSLAKLLSEPKTPEPQRLAALDALAAIDAQQHLALFVKVLNSDIAPFKVRQQSAIVLARANVPAATRGLIDALQTAPTPIQTAIAEALAGSHDGGEALLKAVEAGKASARLLQERAVEGKLRGGRIADLDKHQFTELVYWHESMDVPKVLKKITVKDKETTKEEPIKIK